MGRSSLYYYFFSVDEIDKAVIFDERNKLKTDKKAIDNFLEELKNEHIYVDKILSRAISEYFLANDTKNCLSEFI